MKCSQCPRPAFYLVGDSSEGQPLCLACWSILEDVQFRKWLQAAAMSNQALDDMDDVMSIGPSGGRIPVAEIARSASRSKTYNNIHITNSNVGVVNTGNLARIDAAITMSAGTDTAEFGARLKDLTDAIVNDRALASKLKQEMVEVVQAISDQAIGSKKPSEVVVSTLFGRLREFASSTTTIAGAVEKLYQAWIYLKGLF